MRHIPAARLPLPRECKTAWPQSRAIDTSVDFTNATTSEPT